MTVSNVYEFVELFLTLPVSQGDILNNFATGSVAANGSRGLVAITMIFTYPMQAFVARHVVAKIMFNGDSEGDTRRKLCGCFGRRELMTVTIYIATLVPALIFDDLGPVLSITGAVGGSCLAFIGPGLVYLGAHGAYFIEYTNELCGQKKTTPTSTVELPADGDAKAGFLVDFALQIVWQRTVAFYPASRCTPEVRPAPVGIHEEQTVILHDDGPHGEPW